MAQYYTDFSEYTTGFQPSDWTEQWNNSNNPWIVGSVSEATGGQVLMFSSGTGGSTRRALIWNAVGTTSGDVEIVTRVIRDGGNGGIHFLRLHVSGLSGSETSYLYFFNPANSQEGLAQYNGGSFTEFSVATNRSFDGMQWVRLQRTGNTLRAKKWEDGTSEPSGWDFSILTSSLNSGSVGVGNFANTALVIFDVVGVGTDGDPAPTEPVAPPPPPPPTETQYPFAITTRAAGGTGGWTSPTSAIGPPDGNETSTSLAGNEISHSLGARTNFDLPNDAEIEGIEIRVLRRPSFATRIKDHNVQLRMAGSLDGGGENKAASSVFWNTGAEWVTYGGPTDTWGVNLTPSIVNSTSFGLAFQVWNDSGFTTIRQAFVDAVEITIFLAGELLPPQNFQVITQGPDSVLATWTVD